MCWQTSTRVYTVRIVTFCDDCPNKSHFCLLYFSAKYRFMQDQLLNTRCRVAAH